MIDDGGSDSLAGWTALGLGKLSTIRKVTSSSAAETSNSRVVPILTASKAVNADPQIDPTEPKQPLALLAAEVIGDEAPKDGNDEQVVDAGPDEERTPQPGLFGGGEGAREHVKEQEVENEELVGDADELLDAKTGNQHRE